MFFWVTLTLSSSSFYYETDHRKCEITLGGWCCLWLIKLGRPFHTGFNPGLYIYAWLACSTGQSSTTCWWSSAVRVLCSLSSLLLGEESWLLMLACWGSSYIRVLYVRCPPYWWERRVDCWLVGGVRIHVSYASCLACWSERRVDCWLVGVVRIYVSYARCPSYWWESWYQTYGWCDGTVNDGVGWVRTYIHWLLSGTIGIFLVRCRSSALR